LAFVQRAHDEWHFLFVFNTAIDIHFHRALKKSVGVLRAFVAFDAAALKNHGICNERLGAVEEIPTATGSFL
jgi:hypothetical protein